MGLVFYNIFLLLFKAGIRIAALFDSKAKKWVQGRKGIWEKLRSQMQSRDPQARIVWIHCASLGEFEQGRPLIERLRAQEPACRVLLTFFSPSGYEIRKDYKGADWVFYLPMDGPRSAVRFLQIVKPSLVAFVKYEFWYYYLEHIKRLQIPVLLVSAIFRQNDIFFKWYGAMHRRMLSFFDHLFVQNHDSKALLERIGITQCSISGDTRFDRVLEIADNFRPIDYIDGFLDGKKAIVAGSTWHPDEMVLQKTMETINERGLKLILAPHEINKEHITRLQQVFPNSVCYSQLAPGQATRGNSEANVLLIDNIGMLSRLYRYATIAYVGGGFGKGIHNTLEAAVYSKPVIFGPNFGKFREAADMVKIGGALAIHSAEDCIAAIRRLTSDTNTYHEACERAGSYVSSNRGATQTIINYIQEKRLLTN